MRNNTHSIPSASLLRTGSILLFALAALVPIAVMLKEVFLVQGEYSLENFRVVLLDSRQWDLLVNSLIVSAGAAAVALLLGIPFAFFLARTDLPGKAFFSAIGVLPILIPPLIHAIAWVGICGAHGPFWAMAIFAFSYFPFVWMLTVRALNRMDARIEESARLVGGRAAVLRVTIPYILPSALIAALLVFIFSIADFVVPDYLSSVGIKFNVYADDIFFRWKQLNSSGEAIAASIPPVILICVALYFILRFRRRASSNLGSGFVAAKKIALGKWKVSAFLLVLAIVTVAAILPIARLAVEAGGSSSYLAALREGRTDLMNSLILAVITAIVAASSQLFPALYSSKKSRGSIYEFLVLLPLSLPALLIAIGLIRTWNHPGPILDWSEWVYGTKLVVLFAFLARFSAFTFFANNEAFRAIDPALEQAAASSGIPYWARFRKILMPLVFPALLAGALLTFLFVMREIDSVALIPSGNRTIMFRIYNYVHFGRDALIAALCLICVFLIALPILFLSLWRDQKGETL